MGQPSLTADEIRREMQITRHRVRAEMHDVVDGARQLADWRFYPRQFPLLTLGAAACMGYVLMPRRRENVVVIPDAKRSSDAQTPKAAPKNQKVLVEPAEKEVRKAGVMGALLATAGTALLKVGIAYAGRELTRRFNRFGLEPAREHSHDPSR